MASYRGMQQSSVELPFTLQTRPWLNRDCIEALNDMYLHCMSQIPPDHRDTMRERAISKTEMGYCLERPELMEHCKATQGSPRVSPPASRSRRRKGSSTLATLGRTPATPPC
jgi:hypothetical protein